MSSYATATLASYRYATSLIFQHKETEANSLKKRNKDHNQLKDNKRREEKKNANSNHNKLKDHKEKTRENNLNPSQHRAS